MHLCFFAVVNKENEEKEYNDNDNDLSFDNAAYSSESSAGNGKIVRETPDTHGDVKRDTETNNNGECGDVVSLVEDSVTTDTGGVNSKAS
uniref:Uncharacterized protein n=1 Tax=Amphimedon queenslandica TaxID=400682 RepID=A0A1X7SIT3_AMPQE